jgi:type VI secretion system protein ImpA
MDTPMLPDLLLPVSEAVPCGVDLREDTTPHSIYFRLRDARAEARAAERLADNDPRSGDAGTQHWTAIRSLAVQALAADTKDLEIAAWLTESLVRTDGLRGLAAGAELLAGLVGRFWDAGLHPGLDKGGPDEDGMETRLAPVAGLSGQGVDGTLLQPLRKLALFGRGDGTTVRLWQFEQAEDVAGIGDATKRAQRLAAGVPEFKQLETEARAGGDLLGRLSQETAAALLAWDALDRALSDKAAQAAPNTRRVHAVLAKLARLAEHYGPAAETPAADVAVPDASGPDASGQDASGAAAPQGGRDALLDQVVRIARYFRLSEPNSPFGYTLDDAVRRARLPWPELLAEVLPDAAVRAAVMTGLGLRRADQQP